MVTVADWSSLTQPALNVAPHLIGWRLETKRPEGITSGLIVETEAYLGPTDPASHAFGGPTPRTQVMFGPAGVAYVYFSYGLHYCFNVVTGPTGQASAVLIRALQPDQGIELMCQRRGTGQRRQLTNGPAKLTQALGIRRSDSGHDLRTEPLRLIPGPALGPLASSPRIGVTRATERPWRFYLSGNPYVSRI